MSQYVADSSAQVLLDSYDQLVAYFENACKPRAKWRIGTEYEKVAVWAHNGHAVPFTNGIEEVLRRLADRYAWRPVRENDRIVALNGDRAAITLEPGGQLELSGEQCESVHCARSEFAEHVKEIVTIGEELGIVFLGLGMQPVSTLEEIEWVPKKRYGIMGPYMLKVGTLGQRMMKQTATVQVNIDYDSERDAMAKLRAGMGIGAILNAMFANSPICDGRLNGYLSFRGHIWTDTDNARSGLLPFVFRDGSGFAEYVEYALDVPMYFIVRGERWYDMTALTFRQFWKQGYQGERATLADWNAHLTTLFPETRLKGYIEVRSIDSQSPELMLAVPAMIKGLFYEADCLQATWDLVKKWKWEERLQLHPAVHREALRARIAGVEVRELAKELIAIAETGLDRLRVSGDESEAVYLERLRDLVRRGRCPADLVVEKWNGVWDREYSRLVEGSAYRIAA
ncbi:MAG TPA: glutamate-cysteine ligase family protein [Candidatus Acidoferrales bacterium]|nr:glutamate-cysteine ligase family protein [Candidatus Acidoferrales bacterium]